jgi:flagellar secretion chaperone FliS
MNIRDSYREGTVRGANPVQLVIRLYEQLIEDLRQAEIATEQIKIEERTKRIKHAILVVGHLQSPLDFENGGQVANDLDQFYDRLRQSMIQVQFYPSKPGVRQLITDVLAVREAWIEVDRLENASPGPSPAHLTETHSATVSAFDPYAEHQSGRMDWNG